MSYYQKRFVFSVPRLVMFFLSFLYKLAVVCRNRAFDWGLLRSIDVGVPVISVGNMTVGGTGKTPLVEYITRYCLEKGRRVAIVSRGYKRDTKGVVIVSDGESLHVDARAGGDEPVQMARKFPLASVVVGERRVEAAKVAVGSLHSEVIILDDGFQHRYVKRDLDIVVASAGFVGFAGQMLPAGMNREPWSELHRAGLVALSNIDSLEDAERWKSHLSRWYKGPWMMFNHKLSDVKRLPDHTSVAFDTLKEKAVAAFSGIGNHVSFVDGLKKLGWIVREDMQFVDHHTYVESDVQRIVALMKDSSCDVCVTTEKDAMRLVDDQQIVEHFLKLYPFLYTTIEVEIVEGEEVLRGLIDACLKGKAA
jgi:tetraacyldisaccharide 4'-kinase